MPSSNGVLTSDQAPFLINPSQEKRVKIVSAFLKLVSGSAKKVDRTSLAAKNLIKSLWESIYFSGYRVPNNASN